MTFTYAASILITAIALAIAPGTPVQQTPASSAQAGELRVYIGTYTGAKSKGIYLSRLNPATGAMTVPALVAETPSPSFLALHPTTNYLYAVNEVDAFAGKPTGSVSAFAIDRASGGLTALNQQSSGGKGPAHLIVDRGGANVLVANYGGGSVAALPIEKDGNLRAPSSVIQHTGASVNPSRQKEPHAHSVNLDASGRRAYVADLGLDKIMIYGFDPATGVLTANAPPSAAVAPGSGPRHLALHPSGRFAYVINELLLTVTAFTRDASSGGLTSLQTISTLPPGTASNASVSTAEVQVHPSGKFLYASNRGHDSITVFALDENTGRLTYVQTEPTQGSTPRAFGIDPTGSFLLAANQRSDTVVVFRIDRASGRLSPAGVSIDVGAPVCITFAR
ncbi:MAG TPA: lactonase family protein [Vicinamibacterales bacterium]|nr:lactonase family protein [Vicinamibacterales bacterium]